MDTSTYQQYIDVLREELVPALGCTEPIALAYAGAMAVKLLGNFPEKMRVACSGNIVKNVKGVIVPHSGGQRGIEISVLLGALGGDSDKKLEVLSTVQPEHVLKAAELRAAGFCGVDLLPGMATLHILLHAEGGGHSVVVEIADGHTNVIRLEKDGVEQLAAYHVPTAEEDKSGRDFMSVAGILEFAETCDLDDVRDILRFQIDCNTHISEEGLSGSYGASVGRNLLASRGNDVRNRAKARAAAGSDARMSGCELPVVINSGSGNQGMTVSLPVIEYAAELGASEERLLRALMISNLVAIHQKSGIGKLSAYCGVVSAACGSGAAITWLCGGDFTQISNTIINTLANVSGMVCDGAKPSCAAKIASAVDAAIMGHDLAMEHLAFSGGDGIVKEGVESTIHSVGRLARQGMRGTDEEVLQIMLDNDK